MNEKDNRIAPGVHLPGRMEKAFKEEMVAFRRDINQSNSRQEALMIEHNILRQDFNQSNFRQEALMKEILRLSKRVG